MKKSILFSIMLFAISFVVQAQTPQVITRPLLLRTVDNATASDTLVLVQGVDKIVRKMPLSSITGSSSTPTWQQTVDAQESGSYLMTEFPSGAYIEDNGAGLYINSGGTEVNMSHGNTTFSLNGTGALFFDYRPTTLGIQYNADYSSGFTARSLVDKAYVDNAVSGAGGGTEPKTLIAHVNYDGTSANLTVVKNTFDDVPTFNILKSGTGYYLLYYSGGGTYFSSSANTNITITPRMQTGYTPNMQWQVGSNSREMKIYSYDLRTSASTPSDCGFGSGALRMFEIKIEYYQ